jgi:hypothetical protein
VVLALGQVDRRAFHLLVGNLREQVGDALDDAALAGGVAPFEQDHHAVARVDHPVLQLDRLRCR